MASNVVGGEVRIYGDLHFSDLFTGRHKNYLATCMGVMGRIEKEVLSEENNISTVVLLGDLVGHKEGNISNRLILSSFCNFFRKLKDANKKVFVVKGNHDFIGNYPEFDFIASLGLFETSETTDGYFDYYGTEEQLASGVPEVRFHLVDYGLENRELNTADAPSSNIVLAHNNFTIQGVTTWYRDHAGIELCMQSNFEGVDMVISGHIHDPSPEIVAVEMLCGGSCMLFYTGCPTRPIYDKTCYESCWSVSFIYNSETNETQYNANIFELIPLEEEFYLEDTFVEDLKQVDETEQVRVEALKEVLDDIIKCRMTTGDIKQQINIIPNATDSAKKMACDYLQIALDNRK